MREWRGTSHGAAVREDVCSKPWPMPMRATSTMRRSRSLGQLLRHGKHGGRIFSAYELAMNGPWMKLSHAIKLAKLWGVDDHRVVAAVSRDREASNRLAFDRRANGVYI